MAEPVDAGSGSPPDVSVVIPVYNCEEVLADQLRALGSQTYPGAWEVVVADNGSTDASLRVARGFADTVPGLKIVDASGVRGPSHARNRGARAASGRLLLFCDADDVVSSGWVEAMCAASTAAELIAGSGQSTRDPVGLASAPPADIETPTGFRFLPWYRSSNLAVHRQVFEDVGGFDEGRCIGEDVDFCWRVQTAGHRFRFVPEGFVAYRERPDLWSAAKRQFAFGLAAPGLYRDFSAAGAPLPRLMWIMRDAAQLLLRAPIALVDGGRRERWCVDVAGASGRFVGLVRLRWHGWSPANRG